MEKCGCIRGRVGKMRGSERGEGKTTQVEMVSTSWEEYKYASTGTDIKIAVEANALPFFWLRALRRGNRRVEDELMVSCLARNDPFFTARERTEGEEEGTDWPRTLHNVRCPFRTHSLMNYRKKLDKTKKKVKLFILEMIRSKWEKLGVDWVLSATRGWKWKRASDTLGRDDSNLDQTRTKERLRKGGDNRLPPSHFGGWKIERVFLSMKFSC